MFSKVKSRIFGVQYLLLGILQMFQNRFYTVATDIVLPNGEVNFRSDGDLTESGRLDSTYAVKNIYAKIDYPFNDYNGSTGATAKKALFLYGRTTPVGDATYASAPIGSRFDLFTISANAVTAFAMYVKVATGANGWAKVSTSITAASSVIVGAGTHTATATTIQTITVTGATVGDLPFAILTTANGTGAVILDANTATAGFIVVNLDKAGDTDGRIAYQVVRAVTA